MCDSAQGKCFGEIFSNVLEENGKGNAHLFLAEALRLIPGLGSSSEVSKAIQYLLPVDVDSAESWAYLLPFLRENECLVQLCSELNSKLNISGEQMVRAHAAKVFYPAMIEVLSNLEYSAQKAEMIKATVSNLNQIIEEGYVSFRFTDVNQLDQELMDSLHPIARSIISAHTK